MFIEGDDPRVIDLFREVKDTITASQYTNSQTAETIFTGMHGRAKFNIPKEQLEFLVEQDFPAPAIAYGQKILCLEKHFFFAPARRFVKLFYGHVAEPNLQMWTQDKSCVDVSFVYVIGQHGNN